MNTTKEVSITGHGLSTMCRLCLRSGVTVLDIFFFSTTLKNQVADEVMKYFPVRITRNDGMPKFICQLCFTQLENFHQFQIQVVQSEKKLRQHLQKLHGSDKQIKAESSIRNLPKESLIHKGNTNADITVKSEILDLDVTGKDKATANFNSINKINEAMSLKSKNKEEPMNVASFTLIEYPDDTAKCSPNSDWSEISCEDSKIDIGYTKLDKDMVVNWKENESNNLDSAHTFTDKLFLKSEIKEEPVDILIKTESFDNTTDTVSNGCQRDKQDTQLIDLTIYKSIHTGKKLYQCDVCNKCFSCSKNLKNHKRLHTGEKPYHCKICDKSFRASSDLSRHKRTHNSEKPYQCDVCNKSFGDSSNFIRHKRTHNREKPYQCDVCNTRFSDSSSLSRHKRTHNGEKPYQCGVCNKSFGDSSSLSRHKRIHNGEKPYQCDVCNMRFSQSNTLKSHKRRHTGERPYQCDVCNKSFCQSSILSKHKRTHEC